jgi:hypothetical protein
VLERQTPLPSTLADTDQNTNQKHRPNFSPAAVAVLKSWLDDHKNYPYPSSDEKDILARKTGLDVKQINTWFANNRKRAFQDLSFSSPDVADSAPLTPSIGESHFNLKD